jgi:FixJ family two-component response regulator
LAVRSLTARERETVIELLAQGMINAEIARTLHQRAHREFSPLAFVHVLGDHNEV